MTISQGCFIVVAILLMILSINVINQPIYSLELKDDKNGHSSEKNDLSISMKPLENSDGKVDDVKFAITVTDSNSQPVSDSTIYGIMIYPDGTHKHTFGGKTDENGRLLFPLSIDKRISLGELKTEIKVSKADYKPLSLSGAFSVLGASDSTQDNNSDNDLEDDSDDNDDVQYSITGTLEDTGVYRLAFAGDYGCDITTRETVSAMMKKNPNLVLALGDLSEVKNPECFFDMFKSLHENGKLKIALGYHDMEDGDDSSSRFSQYLSHFNMVEPFYSFDYKNIHFVVMSTGLNSLVPYDEESPQYEFVKSDLAQASINKNIDWIIVCGYRPFYTSPTAHPGQDILKDLYPSSFEKYGVDLVITAHNHNYQRSYPIYSTSDDGDGPEIKDKNGNIYNNPGAPIYVTVGTAGEELHMFREQAPFIATQLMQSGFLDLEILKDRTQLNAKFLDGQSNSDKDSFTISKT
ncbi:MAG: metallophosphoesterase [Nitrososphaeraceae archaeon]